MSSFTAYILQTVRLGMKNQIIKSSQYFYNPGPWEKESKSLTSHELWIRTGWMSLVAYGAEKDTISLKWFLPCCRKRMCYGNPAYAYPEYCGWHQNEEMSYKYNLFQITFLMSAYILSKAQWPEIKISWIATLYYFSQIPFP